jgi:hypothetical protein
MRKIRITFVVAAAFLLLTALNDQAAAGLKTGSGKVTMLRVHEVGSKYGPAGDQLDVEVVFKLDSLPNMAFGFKLRNDANLATHQGMLDLLRDAFNHGHKVHTDYSVGDVEFPRKNCQVFRVWITKN